MSLNRLKITSSGFAPAPVELMLLAQPPLWHNICIVIFQQEIALINWKCTSWSRELQSAREGERPPSAPRRRPWAQETRPFLQLGGSGAQAWVQAPKHTPRSILHVRSCSGKLSARPSAAALGGLGRRDPRGDRCYGGLRRAEPAQGRLSSPPQGTGGPPPLSERPDRTPAKPRLCATVNFLMHRRSTTGVGWFVLHRRNKDPVYRSERRRAPRAPSKTKRPCSSEPSSPHKRCPCWGRWSASSPGPSRASSAYLRHHTHLELALVRSDQRRENNIDNFGGRE